MSIGDLFGDDLKALFGEVGEDSGVEAAQDTAQDGAQDTAQDAGTQDSTAEPSSDEGSADGTGSPSASSADDGSTDAGPPASSNWSPAETAVRTIIAELAGERAESVNLQAPLATLGAEGLGLWAVVAELERQTDRTLPDRVVMAWQTPADMIAAGEAPSPAAE